MATLVNVPTNTSVALSTLAVGTWCLHPGFPGSVLCVIHQVGAYTEMVRFSASQDCVRENRTNTELCTPITTPAVTLTFA